MVIKQKNQRSRSQLLTLKQKHQAHSSKSKSLLHGEEQPQQWREGGNACLYAQDGREDGGEDSGSFLYCQRITVISWLESTVISPHHCRFLARTGSDM
jgi:hypothetical protein